jgi:excisionase family DNA binding protein
MTIEETIRDIVREEVERAVRGLASPAPMQLLPAYLAVREAADLSKVRPETVRGWVNSGALPRRGIGRIIRVRRDQLEAFLAVGVTSRNADLDLDERARDIIAGRIGKRRAAK